jgi:adenylate cyclase
MGVSRRLAAILAADVVGYSRLIEASEAKTLATLKQRRTEILVPLMAKHAGRLFKIMGDGVLIEFRSAVSAVECAVELQHAMDLANRKTPDEPNITLRIGINLGDAVVEGSDLYGDSVNIAARLETAAGAGEILVSLAVFSHVRGKLDMAFEDLGDKSLKNISEPIRVYRVAKLPAAVENEPSSQVPLPLRTLVVLPFLNMSGDLEQEYFSDGITEDIITDLSRISSLSVISRNTAFTFKGRAVNVLQVAKQLNAALVIEGSVRKAGGRVRITVQLIDAQKDSHIWAERYDRDLTDIFAVQDEISRSVVAALKLRLLPQEERALEQRPTLNSNAYQLYLLGRRYLMLRGARNLQIALRFAKEALQLDPDYSKAWALTALCQSYLHLSAKSDQSGLEAADRALAIDSQLAEAHAARGRVLAEAGRFEEARMAHQQSMVLEPDSFDVRHNFGLTCMEAGDFDAAIQHLEQAASLLESDHTSLNLVSVCYLALGDQGQYAKATERALQRIEIEVSTHPDNANAIVHGALALARLGQKERAKEWVTRALIIEPDDPMDQYNAACAWAQMDEPGEAMNILEACVPRMPPEFIDWVRRDADLESLHIGQRFQNLLMSAERSRPRPAPLPSLAS